MDPEPARQLWRETVEAHGPWTAHNIRLAEGVYTLGEPVPGGSESRMRRAVQLVADLAPRPFQELRVADLGCLEGGFAVEFAARGAEVVALDGRETNVAKVRAAKLALSLDSLEPVVGDLRDFTREKYGEFDVVLAFGVAYHFELADLLLFLANVAEACRGLAVVDSEVTERDFTTEVHEGVQYSGLWYDEPTGAPQDRDVLWSSVGNARSFKPTRGSLLRALLHTGFTTALECHLPPVAENRRERATFVAVPGTRQQRFSSCPPLGDAPLGDVPEFWLAGTPPPAGPRGVRRVLRALR